MAQEEPRHRSRPPPPHHGDPPGRTSFPAPSPEGCITAGPPAPPKHGVDWAPDYRQGRPRPCNQEIPNRNTQKSNKTPCFVEIWVLRFVIFSRSGCNVPSDPVEQT